MYEYFSKMSRFFKNASLKSASLKIVLLFLIFIGIFFFPFIFGFILVLILLWLGYEHRVFTNFATIFLSAILALLNTTKLIEGDIIGYNSLLIELRTLTLSELPSFKFITFDFSEPVFLTIAYLCANLFSSVKFFIFMTSFMMFIFFIHSQLIFIKTLQKKHWFMYSNNSKYFSFIVVLCTSFFSITFVMTGHLVKQYLAMGIVAYSISLYFQSSRYKSFVWGMVGVAVHNSMLSIVVSLFVLDLILKLVSKPRHLAIWSMVVITLALLSKIQIMLMIPSLGLLQDDGGIPYSLYLLDFLILLLFIFAVIVTRTDFKLISQLLILIMIHGALLILVGDIGLLSLRVYFTYDVFRAFILTYLFFLIISNLKCKTPTLILISILGPPLLIAYFLFRVFGSQWHYSLNSEQFYLLTITDLLN
jgi:hypothetical protein